METCKAALLLAIARTNVFSWQYFVNYNFSQGWAISSTPTIIANWDAPEGQQWTVPFGFIYFRNVKRPDDAPGTTARFNITFIFPIKS